jgi:hypothetical protein
MKMRRHEPTVVVERGRSLEEDALLLAVAILQRHVTLRREIPTLVPRDEHEEPTVVQERPPFLLMPKREEPRRRRGLLLAAMSVIAVLGGIAGGLLFASRAPLEREAHARATTSASDEVTSMKGISIAPAHPPPPRPVPRVVRAPAPPPDFERSFQ